MGWVVHRAESAPFILACRVLQNGNEPAAFVLTELGLRGFPCNKYMKDKGESDTHTSFFCYSIKIEIQTFHLGLVPDLPPTLSS